MKIVAPVTVGPGVVTVVEHGATAGTARPTSADVVLWVGSVAPSNAAEQDLWMDTINYIVGLATGSYTPTLTGMAVGSGGSATNTAGYTFVGGPSVGDNGILDVYGVVTFGTTGTTFPTSPTISIPSGFNLRTSDSRIVLGATYMGDSSTPANDQQGPLFINGLTTVRPLMGGWASALAGLTTTTPFTWAAGDSIVWNFSFGAVRV